MAILNQKRIQKQSQLLGGIGPASAESLKPYQLRISDKKLADINLGYDPDGKFYATVKLHLKLFHFY